ncbi:MAG: PAS domain S-box protein [Proteobacteria bacterium]|nr:PAS domain S-box protein [Pseudomonadota bacterium]MBU1713784.1 PAS domain S-box protein [Pseudomonadota bacterium]
MKDKSNTKHGLLEKIAREKAALLPENPKSLSAEETLRLLHELRVHKIELEIQNEELLRTHEELEAARARYFDLYDLAPVGYITLSEKGLILEANLTVATLLGVVRGVLVNQPLTRFIIKEDQDIYYLHRKQLFEIGTLQLCDLRMVKKDGTSFWAQLEATAAKDADGTLVCRVLLRDITENKQAERDLIENLSFLQTLIDTIPTPLFYKNLKGEYLNVNRAFEEFYGKNKEEIIGKNVYDMGPKHVADKYYERDQELFQCPGKQTYEWKVVDAAGETRDVIFNKASYTDQEGTITGLIGVISDITEQKRADEALKESENKFRNIAEHSPVGIYIIQDDVLKYVNPKFAEIFDYTVEKCLDNMFFLDLVYPEDRVAVKEHIHRRLSGETHFVQYTFRGIKKTGEIIHVEVFGSSTLFNGRSAATGTMLDITERDLASKKLKISEQQYRQLVDHIAIGVALISPNMGILTLNNQMKNWFPHIDTVKKPLCYQSFNDPPREGICSYCPTVKTLYDGEVHEAVSATPAGNEIRNYRIISSPIKDDKDNVVAAIEMVEDITVRLRTEEQIRLLSQQIMQVQENERQKISYELHDSIAQNLSALKITSDMFCKNPQIISYELSEKMIKHSKLIEETIAAVRNLACELRPPDLEEMGIVKTLEIYCEEFARNNGIRVEFQSSGMQELTPGPEVAIQMYRLVQEGLNNIKKHADASLATIKLMGAFPYNILRIEDDGKGFDVEEREKALSKEKRMGLRSMNERTNLLGGQMTIHSSPNAGTRVVIKIPLKEQTSGSKKTNHNY